jgi:2-C-methyl-D-erythritol 4-phosphate cytidylyltransferase
MMEDNLVPGFLLILNFPANPSSMFKYAIIVAGGTGSRMGGNLPKQFMPLKDKPVLYYSLKAFLDAYDDLEIILVLPTSFTDMGEEIIDAYFDKERIKIAIGGDTRFQSVKNGLKLVEKESIIFVHDAVRCLVSADLIHRCYELAMETGTAVPVIPSNDSVRILNDDGNGMIDRSKVMLVQTPQVFHSKILLPAFDIDYKDKFTDEATVVEAYGLRVSLADGDETNIKITRPVDLLVAENLLSQLTTNS